MDSVMLAPSSDHLTNNITSLCFKLSYTSEGTKRATETSSEKSRCTRNDTCKGGPEIWNDLQGLFKRGT